MSDRLKVGMVGVGGVAGKYHAAYADYSRSELVAVCDAVPEVAAKVAKAHGCMAVDSVAALLETGVGAVVISTPNALHLEQTEQALNAGCHVLLQKPMSLTVAEARQMCDLAAAGPARLGLYMNSLDNPVMHDLKAMIGAGCFGRIGQVDAKLANGRGPSWRGTDGFWRGSKQAVGGGSFAMLATHYINLCQWILDQPITSVSASGDNLMCDHIEGDDIMTGVMRFADGAFGVIGSSWCVKGEMMSLHGSGGYACLVDNRVLTLRAEKPFAGEVVRYDTPGEMLIIEGLSAPEMDDLGNLHNQHRQFVDAVLDGKPFAVPAEKGLQDMQVLAAAYDSAAAGATRNLAGLG